MELFTTKPYKYFQISVSLGLSSTNYIPFKRAEVGGGCKWF